MGIEYITGGALESLSAMPAESVHCCVTSPPYYHLRDYGGVAGQLGTESTPDEYVDSLVGVLREVRRVLRHDGVCFLNLGDTFAANRSYQVPDSKHVDVGNSMGARVPPGLKPKDLMMIPFRVALAVQADGWYLRSVIPWVKRNVLPESVRDRPVVNLEYVFMLTRARRYFWDHTAVLQPTAGGNHAGATRSMRAGDLLLQSLTPPYGLVTDNSDSPTPMVLDVHTHAFRGAHFATFPPALITPLIRASTSESGCCPVCRTPRVRRVEHQNSAVGNSAYGGVGQFGQDGRRLLPGRPGGFDGASDITVGWDPGCSCCVSAPPRPCVVLDCFSGAGTVGLVAESLGRDSILVDLNPDYHDIARSRVERWRQVGVLA